MSLLKYFAVVDLEAVEVMVEAAEDQCAVSHLTEVEVALEATVEILTPIIHHLPLTCANAWMDM